MTSADNDYRVVKIIVTYNNDVEDLFSHVIASERDLRSKLKEIADFLSGRGDSTISFSNRDGTMILPFSPNISRIWIENPCK